MKKCEEIVRKVKDALKENTFKKDIDSLKIIEEGIKISRDALRELHKRMSSKRFSQEEEIYFFKCIKPTIHCELIYYATLYRIESKRPKSSVKSQIKFFNSGIDQFQNYFNENQDFYHYCRRNLTHLDKHYFTRKYTNIKLQVDTSILFLDEGFSTTHDAKVATFWAYEALIKYFKNEIVKLKNNTTDIEYLKEMKLTWSSSKTNLVELIYALHAAAVINKGNIEIKELALLIEKVFNIQLGNYYHTFIEIKARKINQTKFLDQLKKSLIKRIEESDE